MNPNVNTISRPCISDYLYLNSLKLAKDGFVAVQYHSRGEAYLYCFENQIVVWETESLSARHLHQLDQALSFQQTNRDTMCIWR